MIFPFIRPGVLASVVLCLIIIFNYKLFTFNSNLFHLVLFSYILYNIYTFTFYFSTGIPKAIFFQEFSNSMLPITFFFIGKSNLPQDKLNSFYKIFSIAGVFCLIVGIYYLLFPSEIYIRYLTKTITNFVYINYLKDMRLNSFLGSTDIGTLSSILVILSLFYMVKNKIKLKYVLLYVFGILCVGLSMQRSAMAVTSVMIILWHIYGVYKGQFNFQFVFVQVFLVIISFLIIFIYEPHLFDQIITRFGNFSSAFSERSHSWYIAIKNSSNLFFGTGLGSVGHKAIGFSKNFIHDGSYFKILLETGIIGFTLFFLIFFLTFYKYFLDSEDKHFEISIIFVFLFQALGSNVLAFQALLPIFWFSVGRIWNYKRKKSYD